MSSKIQYGQDKRLEKLANQLLSEGVEDNKRSVARDVEKISYESGFISSEDLHDYDPTNDWDTQDSAFAIAVSPSSLEYFEPTICADVDDGNVRARNPKMRERQGLTRHVEDDDHWGSTREDIPPLGVNEGPRKVCTRCKKSKGLQYFSPRKGRRAGLQSWCKQCRKEAESQKRKGSSESSV